MKRILVSLMLLVCLGIQYAWADLTIDLPNTGEAGIGNVETNYVLSYTANLTDEPVPLTAYGYPYQLVGLWVDPPAGSEWIAPIFPAPQGYYFYELNLDIPGIISISGQWATDNDGEIFLNGISTGITKDEWGFLTLDAFTITGGFTGNDTLLFRVWQESQNITGLLVTDLTATVVPSNIALAKQISKVRTNKLNLIDQIDDALAKEQEVFDTLEDLLASGVYTGLADSDMVKAKQKIFSAMQHQEQAKTDIEKSVEKLEDALDSLGSPVEP